MRSKCDESEFPAEVSDRLAGFRLFFFSLREDKQRLLEVNRIDGAS